MAKKPRTTHTRVDGAWDRLFAKRKLTIGQYFSFADKSKLTPDQIEALESHKNTLVHDFMVEEVHAKIDSSGVSKDFGLLSDIHNYEMNDFDILRWFYEKGLFEEDS